MLKKFFGSFLAVTLSLSLLGFTGSAETNEQAYFKSSPEIAKKMELQEQALDAYDILRTTFTIHSDGSESYPDDFAGTWVNAPYLHIALTSDEPDVLQKYQKLLKDFESIIIFEPAKYSMNELDKIRFSVSETLSKEHSLTSHYVDVAANKITLEFLDFNVENIRSSLPKLTKNMDEMFILKKGGLSTPQYDLIGGNATRLSGNSTNYGTIGICGTIYPGQQGFVTHGHGLSVGTVLTNDSGTQIGTVAHVAYHNYSNGDYSFVTKAPGTSLTNKIRTSPTTTINITSTRDDLPVGATFYKYGQKSNITATGYVTATNVTDYRSVSSNPIDGQIEIRGLTQGKLTSGQSLSGDSGGPYYTGDGAFVGVHSGASDPYGVDAVFFTPYVRFKTAFIAQTN